MEYRLAHACIRVMDLEKSIDFYEKALGLKVTRRRDFPEWKFTLVFLSDASGNFEIELTYNYDREEPYVIGNGFGHIALAVGDLENSHKKHKEAGYTVTNMKGLSTDGKPSYYFIIDPDEYKIEIIREK